MAGQGVLALAALIWFGLHVGLAGTRLRDVMARRLGENGFRIAFSVLSVAALVFLIGSFRGSGTVPLWDAPRWLRWALVCVMLPAFILFFGAVASPNATALGGATALARAPRGLQRITRHPMLWSFVLWAAVHVVGNGDSAALLFFGTLGITALAGMPSIDAKLRRREPGHWAGYAAQTSVVPFAAVLQGRARLELRELGWAPVLLGVLVWAAVLHLHPVLFGVSPVPPHMAG